MKEKMVENCGGIEVPRIPEIEPEVEEYGQDGEQLWRSEGAESSSNREEE